jgi:hypothetical protein
MLTLIDNYDSFTYNLVHFLGELGAPARVYRNDKITVDEVLAEAPEAIVLSPGRAIRIAPASASSSLPAPDQRCRSSASVSVIRPSVRFMAAASFARLP